MNPAAVANLVRGLWKVTLSKDPDDVEGQEELKEYFSAVADTYFVQPFKDGYEGHPVQPKPEIPWRASVITQNRPMRVT